VKKKKKGAFYKTPYIQQPSCRLQSNTVARRFEYRHDVWQRGSLTAVASQWLYTVSQKTVPLLFLE